MAGGEYGSIEEYIAAVEKALPVVMEEYAAPYVEDILSDHIMKDIYEAYTPKENGWVERGDDGKWRKVTYLRRYSLFSGIKSRIDGDMLKTTSTAHPSESVTGASTWGGDDGAFLDLLASGNMGLWRNGFPRPAVEYAQQEVDRNIDEIDRWVQKGLDTMLG